MKNWEIRTSERKFHFMTQGTEYYILGRISCYRFLNISPILFHYAIEYFLKAVLCDYYSLEILKKKLHNLPSLLKLYGRKIPASKVMNYTKFIENFHKIYKTRYIQLDGSHRIEHMSHTLSKNKRNVCEFKGKGIEFDLEWSLEEIDELIFEICQDMNIGPTSIYDFIAFVARDSPEFFKDNNLFKKNS